MAGGAAETVAGDKASETLSQFVAKVLQQLALSAWLPAAALIALLAFIVRLGDVLDAAHAPDGAAAAITVSLSTLTHTSVGGALLIGGAVVVLTVVTQAFSFEAIRTLEGYWGTNQVVEALARYRCEHYRRVQRRLQKRKTALKGKAWQIARESMEKEQLELREHGRPIRLSPNVIAALAAEVLGQAPVDDLTTQEEEAVESVDWQQYAPPDLLRQIANVDKRATDFPASHRVLPTRLGNVLRHFEDETGQRNVENLVQDNFDRAPAHVKQAHDEWRTRLDLYASLVFVVALSAVVGMLRLGPDHASYAIGLVVVSGLTGWLMYRAAVTSARGYGPLLVAISELNESA